MAEINWKDYFYYDETSPTCLRWAVEIRSGKDRQFINVYKGDIAGCINDNGYYNVKLKTVLYLCHRIIFEMIGERQLEDHEKVDHADRDKLNNKFANLLPVTHAVNTRNSKMSSANVSGIVGVSFGNNSWLASWMDLDGIQRGRRFTLNKYGSNAKDLAIKARAEAIAFLNLCGAGYSERHGQ